MIHAHGIVFVDYKLPSIVFPAAHVYLYTSFDHFQNKVFGWSLESLMFYWNVATIGLLHFVNARTSWIMDSARV